MIMNDDFFSRIDRTNASLTRWIIFTSVLFVYLVFVLAYGEIKSGYEWQLLAGSQWHLADRSSTLEAKSQYINSFMLALESMKEKGMLSEYNALFLKTPQNNTENNIKALKTLQNRLGEVGTMDTKSFEYNQAIQQITAQEQGEAQALINDLFGSFQLMHYRYVWGWIGGVLAIVACVLFVGIVVLVMVRII